MNEQCRKLVPLTSRAHQTARRNTMKMKIKLAVLSAAVLTVFAAQSALAQTTSEPSSRGDVKAEAKAASKDGSITKGPSPAQKPMSSGGKEKRAEVKAEGKAAERSGQAITEVSPAPKPTRSAKTRAQVKAEAKAAAKAGEIPQGEAGIVKGKP
jgi:hypothetical protein